MEWEWAGMIDRYDLLLAYAEGYADLTSDAFLPVLVVYFALAAAFSVGPRRVDGEIASPPGPGPLIMFVFSFGLYFVFSALMVTDFAQAAMMYGRFVTWLGAGLAVLLGLLLFRFAWQAWRGRAASVFGLSTLIWAGLMGAAAAAAYHPTPDQALFSALVLAGLDGCLINGGLLVSVYILGLALPLLILGPPVGFVVYLIHRFRRIAGLTAAAAGVVLIGWGWFMVRDLPWDRIMVF